MKYYEVIKCKRMALGMSQAEFASMVGVTGSTISSFESGKEVSELVFRSIKYRLENHTQKLSKEEFIEYQIKKQVYSLDYQTGEEKIKTLAYLSFQTSKLMIELMNQEEEEV